MAMPPYFYQHNGLKGIVAVFGFKEFLFVNPSGMSISSKGKGLTENPVAPKSASKDFL